MATTKGTARRKPYSRVQIQFSGGKLRDLRTLRGYSMVEMSRLLGVRYKRVWFWESGRKQPRMEMVRKLATLLRVEIEYFMVPKREVKPAAGVDPATTPFEGER